MSLIKNRACLAAAFLASFCILLAGCGAKTEVVKEKPTVKVEELKKTSMTVTVDYPTKLVPSEDVTVSPEIPGKVSKVFFDVGDEVKKGDILFTLEAEDSKSQLRQTQAALTGTRENVKQQLVEAEAGVQQAKLQYDNIKTLYENGKALYEQGATSKQELDNLETSFKNAKVNLETAQKNLEILKGTDNGGLAAAQTSQAQSAVDAAEALVNNSTIRSPIDGKVSVCGVTAGELASAGMPAFTIINSGELTAEFTVPEEVRKNLSKGQSLELKVGVSGEQELDGVIDTIGLAADSKTGFYTVKLKVGNGAGACSPGSFARVVVPGESREGIFTVPGGAVVSENGIEYLYLVSGGVVEKRIIKTGIASEKAVEVEGELKEGDKVILEGQSFLDEGESVNLMQGGNS
jgi:multidrug efflux pump subunit AcrA (membrane-fusion protein)